MRVQAGASPKQAYHLLQKVSLRGDAGWDYLTMDVPARRLYVSHESQVLVLDADKLEVVGSIDRLDHCHGIALVEDLHRGFITSGGDGKVVVFDTRTLKKVASVRAEKDADGILYDPSTRRVFALNGDGGDATVIDAETLKIVATVVLGGKPEAAVVDGKGKFYDDLVDKDQVVELDAKGLKVLRWWSTAPGTQPAGLAMDIGHGRLFVACRNKKLVVLDVKDGKCVQTLPIGDHVDAAAFDPTTGNVFTSNGDGTLTVIHEVKPDKYRVVQEVMTEKGARTMAFDGGTGRVFTDTAETLPTTPVPGESKWHRKIVPGSFHLIVVGPSADRQK
jgi:YVTN family beta-propeller protein